MKHKAAISLSLAFTSIFFLGSQFAHARTNGSMASMEGAGASAEAMQEAMEMVPADAALVHPLDAHKVQSGQLFKAALNDTVHLKNGPVLPRGTVLVGTVVTDQMKPYGTSKASRHNKLT